MFRLKTNKTKLYQLVSEYETLPPMRRVKFKKADRRPDYWMEWMNASGLWCKAFFSTCLGKPALSIEKAELDGPQVSRVVHTLDAKDLRERGMVEEFATAAERRRVVLASAQKRERENRWSAPGRAKVIHPAHGAVVVPHSSNLAAIMNAAEVWRCNWAEITDAKVRQTEPGDAQERVKP